MPGGAPESPFEIIARVLVPYLGDHMARAAIEVNRHKLGLGGAALGSDDVERLVEQLVPGLRVFVGQDQTARIVDEIRSALAAGGGR